LPRHKITALHCNFKLLTLHNHSLMITKY